MALPFGAELSRAAELIKYQLVAHGRWKECAKDEVGLGEPLGLLTSILFALSSFLLFGSPLSVECFQEAYNGLTEEQAEDASQEPLDICFNLRVVLLPFIKAMP